MTITADPTAPMTLESVSAMTDEERAQRRQAITNRQRADFLRDIAQDGEDLLSSLHWDDPTYLVRDAQWYVTWEKIRERVSDLETLRLLGDLEGDTTGCVAAAVDALARAWLTERGSVPLTLPKAGTTR